MSAGKPLDDQLLPQAGDEANLLFVTPMEPPLRLEVLSRKGKFRQSCSEAGVQVPASGPPSIRGPVKEFSDRAAFIFLAVLLLLGTTVTAQAGGHEGPCDILARAGTPCVAAHSTTRALYAAYNGPLYRVRRADWRTRDIRPLDAGDVANAGAQDAFCTGSVCAVTRIYDQSPEHNDLTIEGAGGAGARDLGANASALPVTLGGRSVYGLSIEATVGYRNDDTDGVARAGQPETIFMVTSGLHANRGCCFDYGNAETNNRDTGNGHMDALNFSFICGSRRGCLGPGPWVQADLENGLFMSSLGGNRDSLYRGNPEPFVTAILKNNGQDFLALRSGDAQTGALGLIYWGHEPLRRPGYAPMHQEGAIVLGTGGDNSNRGVGFFFEGLMTAAFTSAAVDDAVAANIAAAHYGGFGR